MNHLQKNYSHVPDIGYTPALDGLRAIAVMLVLLTHANFQLGTNGVLGVDIFFALSGFLITTLLIEEYRKYGKIHFVAFYIRRTFRLFPALYLLLIVILCYLSIAPVEHAMRYDIMRGIWSSALYVNNISWVWGWGKDEYLLAHTWSLANEEQYYLVWPFILLLMFHFKKNRFILYLLGTIVMLVLFWRLFSDGNMLFSSLWTDSIFIGSFFAFFRYEFYGIQFRQFSLLILLIAILVIGVFPVKWYMSIYQYGGRGFIGIITGILIIGTLNLKSGYLVKILSNKIIVFVGKISYSLYLWHVPIFRLFKWHSNWPPHISFIMKFITTFLVASVSFYLLEKRLTKIGRNLSGKYIQKRTTSIAI
jgi:peptidoglycan/LPS O-acetylase OafA/YrhL